jgi:hypothetical protein
LRTVLALFIPLFQDAPRIRNESKGQW